MLTDTDLLTDADTFTDMFKGGRVLDIFQNMTSKVSGRMVGGWWMGPNTPRPSQNTHAGDCLAWSAALDVRAQQCPLMIIVTRLNRSSQPNSPIAHQLSSTMMNGVRSTCRQLSACSSVFQLGPSFVPPSILGLDTSDHQGKLIDEVCRRAELYGVYPRT